MRFIQTIGIVLLIAGLTIFTSGLFVGNFVLTEQILSEQLNDNEKKHLLESYKSTIVDREFGFAFSLSNQIVTPYKKINDELRSAKKWDEVLQSDPHEFSLKLIRASGTGPFAQHSGLFLFLTFGIAVLGGLFYILPELKILGAPGIKNDHIYHRSATNRGLIAYFVFFYLIAFYILLYFYPDFIVNWIYVTQPIAKIINGGNGSRWFLYGLMYTTIMSVMAVRMFIKYRHNRYQMVRTAVVLFFQVSFAFLIPEIMSRFKVPARDLKNAWPLNYSFVFDYRIGNMIESGTFGMFLLFWGIVLSLILVPIFSYLYGKRWYCSWVCGCGGLAETFGDPYRQHSDKSVKAWKFERYVVHGVLVFAIVMTAFVGWHSFTKYNSSFEEQTHILGISSYDIRSLYGFLIGSIFAGVIGTGFYPIFGNRVWCRFGCPLAAYLGLVQRFKSRFRITTNGGLCISCGNCSNYCEQGIDVRWYAQRGQNVVRSSCVGCGICSAVCPRGVLKLENGPEKGRFNEKAINLNNGEVQLHDMPSIK